ncbi:hypothetical protein [Subtercola boreus]|uniref:hypothetical protein n=1 Tax=Subtercola boreus TaxID=120213 RepID=UPI001559848A|nr:hypothetical protein [Subtercola boreus]
MWIVVALLHAAIDPTTILATGGVDTTTASAGPAGLISIAGIFNYLSIASPSWRSSS